MIYSKYNSLSVKARIHMLQEKLISLGYTSVIINCKRDKTTVKALMDFQSKNGITPNGMVCMKTFEALFHGKGGDHHGNTE